MGLVILSYFGGSASAITLQREIYPAASWANNSVLMKACCVDVDLEPVAARGIVSAMASIPALWKK